MAEPYTPTPEEAKEAYEYTGDGADFRSARMRRRAEFDRMLAAVEAKAVRDAADHFAEAHARLGGEAYPDDLRAYADWIEADHREVEGGK